MDRLLVDLRHALRSAGTRLGSTVGILGVLALGIGLLTTMFSLADPFLFRPLPYGRPDELAVLSIRKDLSTSFPAFGQADPGSIPTLSELETHTELFKAVAAYRHVGAFRLRTANGPMFVQATEVSENLLEVLAGVAVGRSGATPSNATQHSLQGLLLDSAARRIVGSPTNVAVGKLLPGSSGRAVRIAGVLPPDFVFPSNSWIRRTELLVPLGGSSSEDEVAATPAMDQLTVIVRLQRGVEPNTARQVIAARVAKKAGTVIQVTSLNTYLTRGAHRVAIGAVVAGALLLFVCCANVANLLLVRAVSRHHEFATRRALGASRLDLARLMLMEVSLLVSLGVLLALLVARAAVASLAAIMPEQYVALGAPSLTERGLAFGVAAGMVALLAGLGPLAVLSSLWSGSWDRRRNPVRSRGMYVVRFALTAGQTALAVVLVIGAGLLGRSQLNLNLQTPGLSADAVVVTAAYDDGESGARLKADVESTLGALRRLPSVRSAGAAMGPMLDRYLLFSVLQTKEGAESVVAKSISPEYFEAIGARLMAGRWLTARDHGAIVVNQALANRLWPGASAVGQSGLYNGRASTVVGVARDSFDVSLDRPPIPMVYSLLEDPPGCSPDCNRVSYILQTSRSASSLETSARRAVIHVNPDAVVVDVSSIGDRLSDSIKNRSFSTLILTTFAVAALVVCATGLFALVAFAVARQTRDIAIRVAVGARPGHIVFLVAGDVTAAVFLGLALGLIVGRWASLYLGGLLYAVTPGDWQTVSAAGTGVLLVALAATMPPVARALRQPVSSALRVE